MGPIPFDIQEDLTSAFGFLWTQATHLSLIRPTGMVGVKGRSGGWRPGAGRKPGATAVKKKAKVRGKATNKAEMPTASIIKKISSFFAKQQSQISSGQQTCATPHSRPPDPICVRLPSCHCYDAFCLS